MALDAASNGNFNTRYPHQAYQLIENLASSNSTKNADLERKKLGGNMDRSQIAEKPPEQDNEMKSMLKQLLEGQQNMTVSFNGRMDAMYQDLNGKFEALSTHVKKLDVQVAQSAESIKRQEGFLPGKTNINPKHSCHAIMVETGANFVDFEKTATDFRTAEANSCKFQTAPDLTETSKSGAERVYKPKIPFPRGPRKSKQEIEDAKVKAMIDKLMIEIPLVDAVNLSPALRRYVKRMVVNGVSPEEGALLTKDISDVLLNTVPKKKKVMVSEQVSAIIQNKIPEKLPDPGNFVLDCSISTSRFPHSLCDLGSSVNLMPLSVAARLGMTDFKPTRISLIMADRSKRIPQGVLENVPLKIEATAGAIIDVKKGKIELDLGDFVMNFDMDKLRRRSTIDGQSFSVEISKDEDAIREHSHDITAGYVKEVDTSEQVNKLEDRSGDLVGKRSVPPKLTSHPAAIPHFLGRPHAPNAYTPPWMRRHSSQRHLLPLSDPPDA
ncbi:unnamed protein product [Microthlaspi erraticum]|uniref:Aspartic peptidase DDI1-type domain-containing protein n=1 Tax=Microthlaspi erraticum TaxID=1685480 RepID=A0A6D2L281_9BRAS|nr:unnamed protein product [Microthlaspi erraticum]